MKQPHIILAVAFVLVAAAGCDGHQVAVAIPAVDKAVVREPERCPRFKYCPSAY
ncbi:MAG TPA: hypothetical protein VGB92_26020 [Longimicrobium sp.]|jgi:hypothetical protein